MRDSLLPAEQAAGIVQPLRPATTALIVIGNNLIYFAVPKQAEPDSIRHRSNATRYAAQNMADSSHPVNPQAHLERQLQVTLLHSLATTIKSPQRSVAEAGICRHFNSVAAS